ncbi:transmembrane GTPase Fzo1 [Rhizoctonia solani AG-3 Rhs1AP]|uniref:Transmembrane GTPase Fzo1 n=1 Tax=Rhizoctonia solani AG-3 Rhs1AP TaxID=1086054 RepID=X8JHF1_9AGAM|nr:transmembrane GTPase Fzo1 [Rhizoctonia solani AG-3 Rhs1AP]
MSQSFFPTTLAPVSTMSGPFSPFSPMNDSIPQTPIDASGALSSGQEAQTAYVNQRDRLTTAAGQTVEILGDLREFTRKEWVPRYPQLAKTARAPTRSMSFVDDPTHSTDVLYNRARPGARRALTLACEAQLPIESQPEFIDHDEFHVLRLDLSMNGHSPSSLVSNLEKASIAHLLDDRLEAALAHVNKLKVRIADTRSKVLVTGDLNAGKSTLVNALLHRDVLPIDQQPLTSVFSEVHDAIENGGVEEVHVIKLDQVASYDRNNPATFSKAPISDLEELQGDPDAETPPDYALKVYVSDPRSHESSLLNNGIADITLIDAPGLNRDSLKTTSLFARQEEIDVVVFCVNAENHFTLSAMEFLRTAGREKAYVFVVVNRYDQIKDKARCKRRVLEQIKALSPHTYADREELVHFVDSRSALGKSLTEGADEQGIMDAAFVSLESSLRSFVLLKRSKSKLMPAQTYLMKLLSDLELLAAANALLAKSETDAAKSILEKTLPVLEGLKAQRNAMEAELEAVEENTVRTVETDVKKTLGEALAEVASGKLDAGYELPPWRGVLNAWDYAQEVRVAMLQSIHRTVERVESQARITTAEAVQHVTQVGERVLSEAPNGAAARQPRVFVPAAMFNRRGRGAGAAGVGIGLSRTPELAQSTMGDVFDFEHFVETYILLPSTASDDKTKKLEDSTTAISIASLGLGAATMVGTKTFGLRSVVQAIDLLGNKSVRAWAAPLFVLAVAGGISYLIIDLPYSIPRTVGRRIVHTLQSPGTSPVGLDLTSTPTPTFIDGHASRVSRETRKVLRLAAWDVRERYRAAGEETGRAVKEAEQVQKRAQVAWEFFVTLGEKVAGVGIMGGLMI